MDGDVVTAVADVLNRAADLIERDGWVQGHYYTPAGRCIDGALSAANAKSSTTVFAEAWQHLQEVTGSQSTIEWNDRLGRTQAEVVAALRAAAERAA